jgi:2'-5' RNA ligase
VASATSQNLYRTGGTVLLIKVPEAEPVVRTWRSQFDPAAAARVPAHITVLGPFLDRSRVDAAIMGQLDALVGEHQPFDIQLAACARFPGVLYLAPRPAAPFRALTAAIAARWPEAPPYEGQFPDVVPHLTVAHGQEPAVLDMIEPEVAARLPVAARIGAVQLMTYTGDHWEDVRTFRLGGGQGQVGSQP